MPTLLRTTRRTNMTTLFNFSTLKLFNVSRLLLVLALLTATCVLADPDGDIQTNLPALTRWEISARENQRLTNNITWLTHEPLDFLLRRGDHFDDEPERYARMGDPGNIK